MRLIRLAPDKTSPLVIIQIPVLKECSDEMATVISHIANIAVNIACSIIASRLDYCKVIYFGMAEANFHKLLRIQNCAACIVCDVPRWQQHSADLLRQLHRLPMRSRVDFKLAVLCYKAYKLQQPSYLADLLLSYQQPRDLRSTGLDLLPTQASSTTIGARRFSCAAPAIRGNEVSMSYCVFYYCVR